MARMPFLRVSVRVELSLGKHVRCSDMRHFVEKGQSNREGQRERESLSFPTVHDNTLA